MFCFEKLVLLLLLAIFQAIIKGECISNDSQLVYVGGELSFSQTFLKCISNIADPLQIPAAPNGIFTNVQIVNSSIQLNNLHQLDAVTGSVKLDFYLRLYWKDDRLSMPLFWDKVDSSAQKGGIELTRLLERDDGIGIWKPDVRFHDAADLVYLVETIRVNSSNVVFWSRHTVVTFMQPKLNFNRFPNDKQLIHIRYGSYAYPQSSLKMGYWGNPISFNANFDKSETFKVNPIWSFDEETTYSESYLSTSSFLNSVHHIGIKRKAAGIVIRLVAPIAIFLFLSCLSFWAAPQDRLNYSVTLLISVSAIYIVILGNIPLLGYMTSTDIYVFWMFALLVLVIGAHLAYNSLSRNKEQFPLHEFLMKLIESSGRCSAFAVVIFSYIGTFYASDVFDYYLWVSVVVIGVTALVVFFELRALKEVLIKSWTNLIIKVNSCHLYEDEEEGGWKNMSRLEMFLINLQFHEIFSVQKERSKAYLEAYNQYPFVLGRAQLQRRTIFVIDSKATHRVIDDSRGARRDSLLEAENNQSQESMLPLSPRATPRRRFTPKRFTTGSTKSRANRSESTLSTVSVTPVPIASPAAEGELPRPRAKALPEKKSQFPVTPKLNEERAEIQRFRTAEEDVPILKLPSDEQPPRRVSFTASVDLKEHRKAATQEAANFLVQKQDSDEVKDDAVDNDLV